ncbi:MAG: universal stress protein [Chitinophagaceae bacterium]
MNNKIKRILVGIDFSEPSINALHSAACIAEKNAASLYIVYAQDNILEFIGVNTLTIKSINSNSASILSAMANDITAKSDIDIVLIQEKSLATEAILRCAVKNNCDLIVMGTYGATGFRSGYIGTTAYNVIKFAVCPVLLIPPGRKWGSFNNALFPIRPVMTALRHYDIIRNFMESYAILNVIGLSHFGQDGKLAKLDELIAAIGDKLEEDKVTPKIKYNTDGSIPFNVLAEAEKNNADLIIVTSVIDVSTKQFYIGPNTHAIIHNAKVPLLIINKINTQTLAPVKASL